MEMADGDGQMEMGRWTDGQMEMGRWRYMEMGRDGQMESDGEDQKEIDRLDASWFMLVYDGLCMFMCFPCTRVYQGTSAYLQSILHLKTYKIL